MKRMHSYIYGERKLQRNLKIKSLLSNAIKLAFTFCLKVIENCILKEK